MRTLHTAAAVFFTALFFTVCTAPAFPQQASEKKAVGADSGRKLPGYILSVKLPPGFSKAEVSSTEITTAAGIKTQKSYVSEGDDAVIIISVVDTGFSEDSEKSMITALEYALLNYSSAYSLLSRGTRRINGNLFLTRRYTFVEGGSDLYTDLYITHIDTKQFQIQTLGYTEERLDKADLQESVHSFTYLVRTR